MEQPEYILKNGTRVQVHETLPSTTGMMIKAETLAHRTPGVRGQISGIVGGHGGDVYWVRHDGDEDTGSAYGFWEMELEPVTPPSRYDVLMGDD